MPLEVFLIILLAVFLLSLYFLPTIVACNRNHPNIWPIFVVNIFLGFTLLGWVISLAWACAHISISDKDMVKINEELKVQREKIEILQAAYLEKKSKS